MLATRRIYLVQVALAPTVLCGCPSPQKVESLSVGGAWQRQTETRPLPAATSTGQSPEVGGLDAPIERPASSTTHDSPIAVVDGRAVPRARLVELLLRSHGAAAFEQLVVLDCAIHLAAEKGLTVGREDVAHEYDKALQRLSDPLAGITPGVLDRASAERVLDSILSERNTSRHEFHLRMEVNVYLRAIVESDLVITDAQLRAEYERSYGRRVQVRHIQAASLAAIDAVLRRLQAGEDFAETARRHSVNPNTAATGGLLAPFSADDDRVPELLRKEAFALEAGRTSAAIRVGAWYHVLKLDQVLPPQAADFDRVRPDLERAVRSRLTEPAMAELYGRLLADAAIVIHDPILKDAFQARRAPAAAR